MARVVVVVHLNNNYTNFAITLDRPAHVHAPYRFDSGTQTAHTQSHSLSPSNTPFLRNRPHHTAISPFDVDAEVARKTFSFSKGSFSRWDERGERERVGEGKVCRETYSLRNSCQRKISQQRTTRKHLLHKLCSEKKKILKNRREVEAIEYGDGVVCSGSCRAMNSS